MKFRKELRGFIRDWQRSNRHSFGTSLFIQYKPRSGDWWLMERVFDNPCEADYYHLKKISREEAIWLTKIGWACDMWDDLDEY